MWSYTSQQARHSTNKGRQRSTTERSCHPLKQEAFDRLQVAVYGAPSVSPTTVNYLLRYPLINFAFFSRISQLHTLPLRLFPVRTPYTTPSMADRFPSLEDFNEGEIHPPQEFRAHWRSHH